jgi:hypothetical protein
MEIITEALVDTGKLVPFLAVIYFMVGFLEYRYGDRLSHVFRGLGALGPIAGALLGCIPQCGFSVVASALYVHWLPTAKTFYATARSLASTCGSSSGQVKRFLPETARESGGGRVPHHPAASAGA